MQSILPRHDPSLNLAAWTLSCRESLALSITWSFFRITFFNFLFYFIAHSRREYTISNSSRERSCRNKFALFSRTSLRVSLINGFALICNDPTLDCSTLIVEPASAIPCGISLRTVYKACFAMFMRKLARYIYDSKCILHTCLFTQNISL